MFHFILAVQFVNWSLCSVLFRSVLAFQRPSLLQLRCRLCARLLHFLWHYAMVVVVVVIGAQVERVRFWVVVRFQHWNGLQTLPNHSQSARRVS